MKSYLLSLVLGISCSLSLIGQNHPQWINITGNDGIQATAVVGDTLWALFDGGLSLIRLSDGALIKEYNSANSGLNGHMNDQLVVSKGGQAWLASYIALYTGPTNGATGLQFFDGQDFGPAADNPSVLNQQARKRDLVLDSKEVLYFRENSAKLWKLENRQLEEIPLPSGVTEISHLFVDERDNLFAQLGDSVSNIGMYANGSWTRFDLLPHLPVPIEYTNRAEHFGVGPDGKLYFSLRVSSHDSHLLRYDYQNWEYLMDIRFGGPSFLWSPDGQFFLHDRTFNDLRLIDSTWSNSTSDRRVQLTHAISGDFTEHYWLPGDTLWSISGANDRYRLFRATIAEGMYGSYYTENVERINLTTSPMTTNQINNLAVNTDFLKIIAPNSGELITFDGTVWDTLDFFIPSVKNIEMLSDHLGNTYIYGGWSQAFHIHNKQSYGEFTRINYGLDHLFLDNEGSLLYRSGNSNDDEYLIRLRADGTFSSTNIPTPSGYVNASMNIDRTDQVWTTAKHNLVEKPHYFDGEEWQPLDLPPGIRVFLAGHPRPFINKDNDIYFADDQDDIFLYRQNIDKWQFIDTPPNLDMNSTETMIKEDSKGNIWIAMELGLFKFDGIEWTHFNHLNSGISSIGIGINDLDIDQLDNIWLSTDHGISIYNEEGIVTLGPNPYARLDGRVYYDVNNDGLFTDSIDAPFPKRPLTVPPLSNRLYTGDYNGRYGINLLPNDYTVSLQPIEHWSAVNGYEQALSVVGTDSLELDFRMAPDTLFHAADLNIAAAPARCDRAVIHYLHFDNTGTTIMDGRLIIRPDSLGTLLNPPSTLTYDTALAAYTYDFQAWLPFQEQTLELTYRVPNYQFIGVPLEWTAKIQALENGSYTDVDSTSFVQEVRCSYDPNDKLVQSKGPTRDGESLVADELLYTVRFQNTGNDLAFDVRIIDTLDSQLDITTLRVLQASHDFTFSVEEDSILHFNFLNINLPDSTTNEPLSHGLVQFTIKAQTTLPLPLTVRNTAYIYFDNNPPIQTNTTESKLVLAFLNTSVYSPNPAPSLHLFPNPFTDELYLQLKDLSTTGGDLQLSIYSLDGKRWRSFRFEGRQEIIPLNLGGLPPGCYILSARTVTGIMQQKIIKQ